MRGFGEARQSCSFDFKRLLQLPQVPAPLTAGGPQHAVRLALFATLFLLREVEVSTAMVSAWTLNHDDCELWWNLPGSKSGHMALGVKRHWPCVCGLDALFCPYHLAVVHLAWLVALGSYAGVQSPLFPTMDGRFPKKTAVVATFEALGSRCGQQLVSITGVRRFGGHTPRVTGAQLLAAMG